MTDFLCQDKEGKKSPNYHLLIGSFSDVPERVSLPREMCIAFTMDVFGPFPTHLPLEAMRNAHHIPIDSDPSLSLSLFNHMELRHPKLNHILTQDRYTKWDKEPYR